VSTALCSETEIPQTPTTNNNKSHTIRQDAVGVFALPRYTVADIVLHQFYSIVVVDSDERL